MKIENAQLVTHLGYHKFNEKKMRRRRVHTSDCDLLIIHICITCDVKIIIRKLKLNFTLFIRHLYVHFSFARSSLPEPKVCVRVCARAMRVFTSNHCRLSALSSAITLHTNSYPSIFISDSYRKNHFVHDPRFTIHDKLKGINTLFLDNFFLSFVNGYMPLLFYYVTNEMWS